MRRKHAPITTATTLTLAAAPLTAAHAASDKAKLSEGRTAEQLFDTEVRGASNEDIGQTKNIVVNADGQATKIIVEAGGAFAIGDTHFAVPWDRVEFGPDMEWVQVPVDEDSIEHISLFDADEARGTAPGGQCHRRSRVGPARSRPKRRQSGRRRARPSG